MIETFIRDRLIGNGGIAALVSNRVYPSHLPEQTSQAAISFSLVSRIGRDIYHGGSVPYVSSRFQFSCWAPDPLFSKRISGAVKSALIGYSGTYDGTQISYVRHEDEIEFFEEEVGSYMTALDLVIMHTDN